MDADLYKKAIKNAIAGEIEAKEFYLKISEKIRDSYLKELFLVFSKEEANHEKILTALLDKGRIKPATFNGTRDFKISETRGQTHWFWPRNPCNRDCRRKSFLP